MLSVSLGGVVTALLNSFDYITFTLSVPFSILI